VEKNDFNLDYGNLCTVEGLLKGHQYLIIKDRKDLHSSIGECSEGRIVEYSSVIDSHAGEYEFSIVGGNDHTYSTVPEMNGRKPWYIGSARNSRNYVVYVPLHLIPKDVLFHCALSGDYTELCEQLYYEWSMWWEKEIKPKRD